MNSKLPNDQYGPDHVPDDYNKAVRNWLSVPHAMPKHAMRRNAVRQMTGGTSLPSSEHLIPFQI